MQFVNSVTTPKLLSAGNGQIHLTIGVIGILYCRLCCHGLILSARRRDRLGRTHCAYF